MVDFRKALLVLIVLVFAASFASAQVTPTLTCANTSGVPPPVRAEGLAEEIGQITLTCTGGVPTAAGAVLPTVNVQLFLNTNVTSKLLTTSDNRTEALLLIDEPKPAGYNRNMTDVIEASYDSTANAKFDSGEVGTQLVASFPFTSSVTATGTGRYEGGREGRPNVFVSQYNSLQPGTLTWLNIPFDPPGTTNNRTIRIANVRARIVGGSFPPASGLVPASVSAFLSISGTGGLAISQQTLTVAYVQQSMTSSVTNYAEPMLCLNQSKYFTLNFTELFGTAFRQKQFKVGGVAADQDVPGTIYNTESMFFNTDFDTTAAAGAGLATTGTRLMAKFINVPAGVSLYVPSTITSTAGDVAELIANDGWTASGGNNVLTLNADRSGTVYYEVTTSIPGSISTLSGNVGIGYSVTSTPDVVAYAAGFYAPQSTYSTPKVVTSDPATWVPRFFQDTTIGYQKAFQIKSCQTNLLFPWVAYVKGQNWDTGFAIANTTTDLWGTKPQYGSCSLNYYSGQGNAVFTTPVIQSGTVFTATMSAGDATGTVKPFPGDYAGYMIASCKFQMAHAYAFLTNGVTAEGYLALVLDGDMFGTSAVSATLSTNSITGTVTTGTGRTGVNSEKLVH